jgi:glycine cleavage system regulatory protein
MARALPPHCKNMARAWQEHGANIAISSWQHHGKNIARTLLARTLQENDKNMSITLLLFPHHHCKSMARTWQQEHGKNMARSLQYHGKNMAITWQGHGKSMARAWQ